jgi:hypothetical protein
MSKFVPVVRIFYTVALMLYGLALAAFTYLSVVAGQHGHIATTPLWWQSIPYIPFILLLISRIMYYRDPRWLWLGLVAFLAVGGLIGSSFLLPQG